MDWEAMTLARFFQHLGYWGDHTHQEILSQEAFGEDILSSEARKTLVREINRILRSVQT
jgi:hypothetical protein